MLGYVLSYHLWVMLLGTGRVPAENCTCRAGDMRRCLWWDACKRKRRKRWCSGWNWQPNIYKVPVKWERKSLCGFHDFVFWESGQRESKLVKGDICTDRIISGEEHCECGGDCKAYEHELRWTKGRVTARTGIMYDGAWDGCWETPFESAFWSCSTKDIMKWSKEREKAASILTLASLSAARCAYMFGWSETLCILVACGRECSDDDTLGNATRLEGAALDAVLDDIVNLSDRTYGTLAPGVAQQGCWSAKKEE